MVVGRDKKWALRSIKDRVLMRIGSWLNQCLSLSVMAIFIKFILQEIPIYPMSCFLFPSSFCKELEALFNRYWWGKGNLKRGIHWSSWEALCESKEGGGLGFRSLSKLNIALLAKQDRHLMNNLDSLVARVIKAKYYPTTSFMESKLGHTPSYLWRSIWASNELLRMGCRWCVGDGFAISI